MNTQSGFPDHNIDPRKKDKAWHLQFAKAAWKDCEGVKMFYHNAQKYDETKSYALGRQNTSKYKKPMHVDEQSDTTFAVLDFKVLPIVKKHRQIALGRLQKGDYNIVATPIDALARDEADKYYQDIKAKILLRNQLLQTNPELAKSPLLQPDAKEPLDLEELEMQMEFGFKHNYAMEAEQGIQLIFDQNNIKQCRDRVFEDLFDDGVAVYKDWMEESGKVRFRNCDKRSVITNYCRYPDFRDILYCGEVVDKTIHEFKEEVGTQFSADDLEEIESSAKNGNNKIQGRKASDKNKVRVLELEFFSTDEIVYDNRINKYGNPAFGKTDYAKKGKKETLTAKRVNVYKVKWIVGTEFVYDEGLASYQKRDKGLTNTKLSFHIVATNFFEMSASGVMEDIIPIADQMAIAWLKLQNIRNELKPYFVEIDLDALEDVNIGKGGENMSGPQLLQMWAQKGILITRRKGLSQNNPNYKTIEFVATNYGEAIAEAWNDFNNHVALLREATGFNELTDGSTPNPKTQNPATYAAIESTNNALYFLQKAEESLLLSLAEAVLCRMRRAIKMGKVEGFIHALGTNTIKFIEVTPEFDLHDYGIKLESKPTPEQKQWLQQMMAKGMTDGTLEPTDIIMVESVFNLKQAEQILAFRIKKRKELAQQNSIQLQQANAQTQIQSAQATAQMDMQKLQLEYDLKLRNELQILEKQKEIKGMELLTKQDMNTENNQTKKHIQSSQNGIAPETPLPPDSPGQEELAA
jgi:hypothetical protein